MLTAFDLCLGACRFILTLAGTAIDFVVDRLTGFVLLQCFGSFLHSEIAAVPIDFFLVSGKKFRGHRNIMLVGSCHFYRMNQTAFLIYPNMGFIAEVPYIAFFCRVSLRITFLVEEEASINVESTIVPRFKIKPRCIRSSTTCANSSCWIPFLIRMLRNRPSVSPSALDCWILLRKSPKRHGCRLPRQPLPYLRDYTDFVQDRFSASVPNRRACCRALLYK